MCVCVCEGCWCWWGYSDVGWRENEAHANTHKRQHGPGARGLGLRTHYVH